MCVKIAKNSRIMIEDYVIIVLGLLVKNDERNRLMGECQLDDIGGGAVECGLPPIVENYSTCLPD